MENATFTVTDDLLASQGQRFLNFGIDVLIQYVIILGMGTTIELIADITNNYALSDWLESMSRSELLFYVVFTVFFYYYLTEVYFSRTFAKYFTKTIVVTNEGLKPHYKMILIRTLCRFIPFEAFSFLSESLRGWHDRFSGTYVVKKKRLTQKRDLFYHFDEIAKV